jgi:hypothetical protein
MMQRSRSYTYDPSLLLDDGGAAHTAAGWGMVGGSPVALAMDVGGMAATVINLPSIADSSTLTLQAPRIDLVAVIYVNAITLAGSDIYRLTMVGSNNAGFASGNVQLASMQFGTAAGLDVPNCGATHAPGGAGKNPAGDQYELLFTNEWQGTPLQYIGMYVSGTFGSITFQSFIAMLPRE